MVSPKVIVYIDKFSSRGRYSTRFWFMTRFSSGLKCSLRFWSMKKFRSGRGNSPRFWSMTRFSSRGYSPRFWSMTWFGSGAVYLQPGAISVPPERLSNSRRRFDPVTAERVYTLGIDEFLPRGRHLTPLPPSGFLCSGPWASVNNKRNEICPGVNL